MPSQIRLAEVLSALSLTTDLGAGVPFEKGLRTCVVASGFARALDLGLEERRSVFNAALLRSIGCTANAPELAELFGDEVRFQRALKELDPADPQAFALRFGDWDPEHQPELVSRLVEVLPTAGPPAMRSACEVSAALGERLGVDPGAIAALDDVYERWDGRGIPGAHEGENIDLVARIVHVSEQAVFAHYTGGTVAARREIDRRAGGHLDPELCAAFQTHSEAVLAGLEGPDMLAAVMAAEPRPHAIVDSSELGRLCMALAAFTDLKGLHLVGHSPHVAELAAGAAGLMGMDAVAAAEVHAAGLVHDIGRSAVSSEIWDRPGPLGPADHERVRLHSYWTDRILARVPAVASLSSIAGAHHERLDGTGYHRGTGGQELGTAARVLAAADSFAAMTEARPHRLALTPDAASRELMSEASAGRLDPAAVAAVIEAAGLPRPRSAWPNDLTDREVDVLRLCSRGLTNREIADSLVVSARTVQHHLSSIYDKTGRRTRAGAAVFAVEHGLASW